MYGLEQPHDPLMRVIWQHCECSVHSSSGWTHPPKTWRSSDASTDRVRGGRGLSEIRIFWSLIGRTVYEKTRGGAHGWWRTAPAGVKTCHPERESRDLGGRGAQM